MEIKSYEIYYKGLTKSFPLDALQIGETPVKLVLKTISWDSGKTLNEETIYNY